jgi:uncharacterized membrane protein YhhN
MVKKYNLEFFFFLVLFLEILFGELGINIGVYLLKPLLMPVLFSLIYLSKRPKQSSYIYLALFFSWLGDVVLMFPDRRLFIFGLVAFLIAHIFYIFLFIKISIKPYYHTLGLVLVPIIFNNLILPHVPTALTTPVIIYFLVITTMAILASCRNLYLTGNKEIIVGSLFFVVSDTILAYNKFVVPIQFSTLFVMFTYGLGQYLITKGWLKLKI